MLYVIDLKKETATSCASHICQPFNSQVQLTKHIPIESLS